MKLFSKNNYIFLITLAFLVGIFITLVAQRSPLFLTVSSFVKQYIGVIAIIISPLVALWAGNKISKNTEKRREEYEVLKNIISYRHNKTSHEFLSALNRTTLIFDRNEKIKQLIRNLWQSYVNKENSLVSSQKEVELIHEICKYKGYSVSEFDINNFFIQGSSPKKSPATQVVQQNQQD